MEKIMEVMLFDDYKLVVLFTTNRLMKVDMKKKLHMVRFSKLWDQALFKAAATDGKSIYWPGGLSIHISEIIELAEKMEI